LIIHCSSTAMRRDPFLPGDLTPRSRRSGRPRVVLLVAALAGSLGSATVVGFSLRGDAPSASGKAADAAAHRAAAVAPRSYDGMLEPTPSWSLEALAFVQNPLLAAEFSSPARPEGATEPRATLPREEQPPPPPDPKTARSIQTPPLPVPRPADLRGPSAPGPSQTVDRAISRPKRTAAVPVAPEDNRSFFEKLFGVQRAQGPALGYAALGSGAPNEAPQTRTSPSLDLGAATAVYDISARTLTLPNRERLEAHSGLGDKLDDPRFVHVRMRGATPPGTYDLTEREQPFHGVRALRLNPVGGSGAVHGRTGLLAHTYLLGPKGDSNGCVSIRDYDRFLQAYLRGEVKRLVVVPGRGGDGLPGIASPSNSSGGGPRRLSALHTGDM
jgi:hypothetical protein